MREIESNNNRTQFIAPKNGDISSYTGQIEALPTPEPFVIRGHHLKNYVSLTKFFLTPDMLAEKPKKIATTMRNAREKDRGETVSEMIKLDAVNDQYMLDQLHPQYNEAYGYDVIGETEKQADQFEKNIQETFERFLQLPDDAPVKLVAEQKDEICNSCIFGNHCSAATEDKILLSIFNDLAKDIELDDKIRFIEEDKTSANLVSKKTISITTTADVFQSVLRSFRLKSQNEIDERMAEKFRDPDFLTKDP